MLFEVTDENGNPCQQDEIHADVRVIPPIQAKVENDENVPAVGAIQPGASYE